MKNMLGEDVQPHVITFKWMMPVVDCHWKGCVYPNGWIGGIDLHCALGEPIFTNFNLWHTIGFNDMQRIMSEWAKNMTPDRCMLCVISRLAVEQSVSFDDTIRMLKSKEIPFYADPKPKF